MVVLHLIIAFIAHVGQRVGDLEAGHKQGVVYMWELKATASWEKK